MNEMHPHNNPWADKLLDVTLPDRRKAWTSMELLLEREMPLRRKKDQRRWLLLLLLLLLLLGICNCPGRGRPFGDASGNTGGRRERDSIAGERKGVDRIAGSGGAARVGELVRKKAEGRDRPKGRDRRVVGDRQVAEPEDRQQGSVAGNGLDEPSSGGGSIQKPPLEGEGVQDSTRKKLPASDSAREKPAASPKKDAQKKNERGFVIGIGLNKVFPVSEQLKSDYNSESIGHALSDNIPVPMVRYYFNRKLYVQLETQLHAPQYTRQHLVLQASPPVTLSSGLVSAASVSVEQLFYINVPLSIHYSPIKDLSLGVGLEYSRLQNAIGSFDTTFTNSFPSRVVTVVGKHSTPLKGDTLFHRIRPNELRFLVDINYTYNRFVFGARYDQALSDFVHLQVAPGMVTQSRNSSLQFYLRYILWDGRKKKGQIPLPAK
jgi:hypothetical protein